MNRNPYLPLTETVYYTLVALLEPCHGYKILQKVKQLSNGQVHLAPGTLYGALENLEKQGLITLLEEVDARKKVFQIAPKGFEVLQKDQQRLMHMAKLLSESNPVEPRLQQETKTTFPKAEVRRKKNIKKKEEELFY